MTAVCCELASNRLLKIKRQDKEIMREASPALGVTLSCWGGRGQGVDDKPRSEGGVSLRYKHCLFQFWLNIVRKLANIINPEKNIKYKMLFFFLKKIKHILILSFLTLLTGSIWAIYTSNLLWNSLLGMARQLPPWDPSSHYYPHENLARLSPSTFFCGSLENLGGKAASFPPWGYASD